MKWFKHFSDASTNDSINRLEQEFGYEGYGVYWKLVEKCCAKWDGISEPVFTLNKVKTRLELRLKSVKTQSILSLISVCKLADITETEFDYVINFPKLREIKDNTAKDLQAKSKRLASNLPLDKIRIEEDKNNIPPPLKRKKAAPSIPATAASWVEAFNAYASTRFTLTASVARQILENEKLGYALEDARAVVAYFGPKWVGDEKMGAYWKPSTLFNNKFPDRVEQARNAETIQKQAQYNKLAKEFELE